MTEGKSSLPPKAPPVSVWMTRHFSAGRLKTSVERVDEVVGALHGAADGDAFEVPSGCDELGDDAVVFDVELLLRAGAVLAFDDEVGVLRRLLRSASIGLRRPSA